MKRALKIGGGLLLSIIILISVLLLLVWKTEIVQRNAESVINRALSGKGRIRYTVLKGTLFNTLKIEDMDLELFGTGRFRAKQVELEYDLWPLFSQKIHINKVFVNRLDVDLYASESQTTDSAQVAPPAAKVSPDSMLKAFQKSRPIAKLLNALPEIHLESLELFAGTIAIPSEQMHLSNVYADLPSLVVTRDQYRIKLNKLSGVWDERDFELQTLSFELKGNREHLELNQFKLLTPASNLQLSAYYDLSDTIDVSLNLYDAALDLNDLYKLAGDKELRSGFVQGSVSLSGAPRNFSVQANVKGRWKGQRLDTLQLDVTYDKGDILVNALHVQSGKARFDLQGAARQFNSGYGLFRFERVNLNQFDSTQVATDLNGLLKFNVSNLVLKRATGEGELQLDASRIDRLPIERLRFKLKAKRGNFTIVQPSFMQVADSCRFTLEGTVSRHWTADLALSAFDTQLGRLTDAYGVDSLNALFDGQFRLSGNLKDPTVSGDLEMRRLRYQDMQFDSVALQLYTSQIFSAREGELRFDIRKGDVGGIPLDNLTIAANIKRNRIHCTQAEVHSAQNYLKTQWILDYHPRQSIMRIPHLEIMYEHYRLRNDGALEFTMDSTEINIDNFRLLGAAGSAIEAGGFWDKKEADMQAFLLLQQVRLKPFEIFWKKQFDLSGIVNGTVEILHPLHEPELNAEIRTDSLCFNTVPLGAVSADFSYAQRDFQFKKFSLIHGNTRIAAQGNFTLPSNKPGEGELFAENLAMQFVLNWNNVHLEQFAPLLKPNNKKMIGLSSGRFRLNGSAGHPRAALSMALDDFAYDSFKLDSTHLFAQYNDGYMLLDSLYGVLNRTSFDLRGWLKYTLNLTHPDTMVMNKPLHLALRSSDNEISFIGLLNEQVEAIRGPYALELEFGGTSEAPALTSGFIKMDNGEIILSRVRDPLTEVKIDADIERSVLYMNGFTARSEREKDFLEQGMQWIKALIPWSRQNWREGFLEVDGTVATANLLRPRFDLNIQMDAFYVDYFVENAAVVLSSDNLALHGRDTLRVTGDIRIPRGFYEVDLSKMSKNAYLSSATVTQTPPFTAVNIGIDIPGNFVVSSSPLDLANNFKITLLGNLHIIVEPPSDATQIAGHMETVSGKYASWNQNFDIQNGTIDFKNPKEINPDVNLLAVKKIGNRLFEVSVTGPLDDMDQTIRVMENDREVDMSYLDKIALLTLGADLGQITTQTDSTLRNVGEQVATTSVLTAVERGAEKYVGLDKVEINSSRSILDLERMRLNNGLQDASISFGKYLTSDLYVEYRTQFGGEFPTPKLSWDAGNRIGLQYRINRYWSLDSFYEKTQRGNNTIQLGIKWELTF